MSHSDNKMTEEDDYQRLSIPRSVRTESKSLNHINEFNCSTNSTELIFLKRIRSLKQTKELSMTPQKLAQTSPSSSAMKQNSFSLHLALCLAILILTFTASCKALETSLPAYRFNNQALSSTGRSSQLSSAAVSPLSLQSNANVNANANSAIIPQNWARGLVHDREFEFANRETQSSPTGSRGQEDQSLALIVRRNTNNNNPVNSNRAQQSNMMKSVRHIVTSSSPSTTSFQQPNFKSSNSSSPTGDTCADKLCYGLPMGCVGNSAVSQPLQGETTPLCSVLVTSKRFIDPNRPISRDILFELIALPAPDLSSNYAAVGFSETGRMAGLVSECLQYRDAKTQLHIIKLKHSYNIPGIYHNIPVSISSGVKNLGVTWDNGYYQCRWIVESAVEFSYEATNGSIIQRREDLGYKNYHILLATGEYNEQTDTKGIHTDRVSSFAPVSLAQTGHIKSLGSHILIRIHGSLMIAIWVGLVTLSIVLARYYKNEWSNSKISDLAIWFIVHRTLMLTSWFGSVIAVIFAYMYTETYHPVSRPSVVERIRVIDCFFN